MASPGDLSVRTPSDIRKKKLSGQRKKEELEREVSLLKRMLHQEEKVHEVLDQVHNRKNGDSAISIPRFLPPKVFIFFLLSYLMRLTFLCMGFFDS
ncbi:hypothetical protein D8674_021289 [Pyrus ussuriensis x Pyrus communis]|uniref:Ternary complex factor MIP1 leucine-zipper domain-containing protein n=1 Tax=Pyrus ussuriensis x Pyrus communis TaxID=2448454 RepID=A0A5N5GLH0_9ROSA|nr:hypothetical protein D8674_021289 [Pyrus ussuriensis x Pyrus communis]